MCTICVLFQILLHFALGADQVFQFGAIPTSPLNGRYEKVDSDKRCDGEKLFHGGSPNLSFCKDACNEDERCNYFAFWVKRKYCETYHTCQSRSQDGKNQISLWLRVNECEAEIEHQNSNFYAAITQEFPLGVVRSGVGKNLHCQCTTRVWLLCVIFVTVGGPAEIMIQRRLDRTDPRKLRPFFSTYAYKPGQKPSPIGFEYEDVRLSSKLMAEIQVMHPSNCLHYDLCRATPGVECPIEHTVFKPGDPVFILRHDAEKVKAGFPVMCISVLGARKLVEGQRKGDQTESFIWSDPFGRSEDGIPFIVGIDYLLYWIFSDQQLATGICQAGPWYRRSTTTPPSDPTPPAEDSGEMGSPTEKKKKKSGSKKKKKSSGGGGSAEAQQQIEPTPSDSGAVHLDPASDSDDGLIFESNSETPTSAPSKLVITSKPSSSPSVDLKRILSLMRIGDKPAETKPPLSLLESNSEPAYIETPAAPQAKVEPAGQPPRSNSLPPKSGKKKKKAKHQAQSSGSSGPSSSSPLPNLAEQRSNTGRASVANRGASSADRMPGSPLNPGAFGGSSSGGSPRIQSAGAGSSDVQKDPVPDSDSDEDQSRDQRPESWSSVPFKQGFEPELMPKSLGKAPMARLPSSGKNPAPRPAKRASGISIDSNPPNRLPSPKQAAGGLTIKSPSQDKSKTVDKSGSEFSKSTEEGKPSQKPIPSAQSRSETEENSRGPSTKANLPGSVFKAHLGLSRTHPKSPLVDPAQYPGLKSWSSIASGVPKIYQPKTTSPTQSPSKAPIVKHFRSWSSIARGKARPASKSNTKTPRFQDKTMQTGSDEEHIASHQYASYFTSNFFTFLPCFILFTCFYSTCSSFFYTSYNNVYVEFDFHASANRLHI